MLDSALIALPCSTDAEALAILDAARGNPLRMALALRLGLLRDSYDVAWMAYLAGGPEERLPIMRAAHDTANDASCALRATRTP